MPIPPCPPDMTMERHLQRYQCQPWHVRLWRRRHLLPVPFRVLRAVVAGEHTANDLSIRNLWSIEVGLAHARMGWILSWFECFGEL